VSGFLYFIPAGRESTFAETLKTWGLAHAAEKSTSVAPLMAAGPSGAGGVIAADPAAVPQITYNVDAQTWAPTDNPLPKDEEEKFRPWIGVSNDNPPTPLELLRADALDGHVVKLADGNDWLIPIVRGWTEVPEIGPINQCALPHSIRRSGGHWQRDGIQAKYVPLWAGTLKWWEFYTARIESVELDPGSAVKRVPFDFECSLELASDALAANYRVGVDEIGLMAVFNETLVRDVLLALIDWPFVRKWAQKKKPSDSTTGG